MKIAIVKVPENVVGLLPILYFRLDWVSSGGGVGIVWSVRRRVPLNEIRAPGWICVAGR